MAVAAPIELPTSAGLLQLELVEHRLEVAHQVRVLVARPGLRLAVPARVVGDQPVAALHERPRPLDDVPPGGRQPVDQHDRRPLAERLALQRDAAGARQLPAAPRNSSPPRALGSHDALPKRASAARRRRAVPHRRWDRDHADLPPGARPAAVRRVRACSRTRRAPRRCGATTSRTSSWRGSAGSASCSRAPPGVRARAGPPRSATAPSSSTRLNRKAIALMEELRSGDDGGAPIVISGCIGPQDDGYSPEAKLSAARGAGLPLDPDRDVRRHERGHGLRGHA